jgi:hypothetical protein
VGLFLASDNVEQIALESCQVVHWESTTRTYYRILIRLSGRFGRNRAITIEDTRFVEFQMVARPSY